MGRIYYLSEVINLSNIHLSRFYYITLGALISVFLFICTRLIYGCMQLIDSTLLIKISLELLIYWRKLKAFLSQMQFLYSALIFFLIFSRLRDVCSPCLDQIINDSFEIFKLYQQATESRHKLNDLLTAAHSNKCSFAHFDFQSSCLFIHSHFQTSMYGSFVSAPLY